MYEPILLLGSSRFSGVDIRIRVRGGGYVSQVYAIRQVKIGIRDGMWLFVDFLEMLSRCDSMVIETRNVAV